ncbi:MAG: hypothetical protein L0Z54_00135 [Thermoplasmata archaeon]|nr:hypothetical protein [Thermoplasmata archaeon]
MSATFFRRRDRKKAAEVPAGVRKGVWHPIDGKDVVFDLGGRETAFEAFELWVDDDGLKIVVRDLSPGALLDLAGTVVQEVDIDREVILAADSIRVVLCLRDGIFRELSSDILGAESPVRAFDTGRDGQAPLLSLTNYTIRSWKAIRTETV